MTPDETKQLLEGAIRNITSLRDRVRFLEPKAHGYDMITKILGFVAPSDAQGYEEDILWRLGYELKKLQDEEIVETDTSVIYPPEKLP